MNTDDHTNFTRAINKFIGNDDKTTDVYKKGIREIAKSSDDFDETTSGNVKTISGFLAGE